MNTFEDNRPTEYDKELAEEEKLNDMVPWELAFEQGEEMAKNEMFEEEWEDEEEYE